jgi:hypothetical protein
LANQAQVMFRRLARAINRVADEAERNEEIKGKVSFTFSADRDKDTGALIFSHKMSSTIGDIVEQDAGRVDGQIVLDLADEMSGLFGS